MLTRAFRIPHTLETVSSRESNAALTLTELSIPAPLSEKVAMPRFNLQWKSNVHSPVVTQLDCSTTTRWKLNEAATDKRCPNSLCYASTSLFFWLMIKLARHIFHRTEFEKRRDASPQIYSTLQFQFSTMKKCLLVHILSYSHVLTSKKPWTTKRFFFSSVRYSDRG